MMAMALAIDGRRPVARWLMSIAGLLIALVAGALGVGMLGAAIVGQWPRPGSLWMGVALGLLFTIMAVYGLVLLARAMLNRLGMDSVMARAWRAVSTGKRPREWDLTLAELCVAADSRPRRDGGVLVLFTVARAFDEGAFERGKQLLARTLTSGANLHEKVKGELQLQAVLVSALHHGDAVGARRDLEAVTEPSGARTEKARTWDSAAKGSMACAQMDLGGDPVRRSPTDRAAAFTFRAGCDRPGSDVWTVPAAVWARGRKRW